MKTTFILKDKSEQFYEGVGQIAGLNQMPDADKFSFLNKIASEGRATVKVGNGSFRDRVKLNSMLRSPCRFVFKLEPRKGYKLATFEITATLIN